MSHPAPVERWLFTDPATGETYRFPMNPHSMGSIFASRNLSVQTTTAVGGQALVFEGNMAPFEWEFEGAIFNHDHYDSLRRWVYEKPNRIYLRDHFGRTITLTLQSFAPIPKRRRNKYWSHDYTITAIVFNVGPGTVKL